MTDPQPVFTWAISAGTVLDGILFLLGAAVIWGGLKQKMTDISEKQKQHEVDIRDNSKTVQDLTINMTRLAMAQENTEKNIGSLSSLVEKTIVARLSDRGAAA